MAFVDDPEEAQSCRLSCPTVQLGAPVLDPSERDGRDALVAAAKSQFTGWADCGSPPTAWPAFVCLYFLQRQGTPYIMAGTPNTVVYSIRDRYRPR
jgi:hypothetical protein